MATDRWQAAFQQSSDAVFFLNRQKRIQFVNPAWETLAGLKLDDVRGLVCKRQARTSRATLMEQVQAVLLPPREVLQGDAAQVRRPAPLHASQKSRWWDIAYFPLGGAGGLVGILGKITPVADAAPILQKPVPASIMAFRRRFFERFALDRLSTSAPAMRRVANQANLAARTDDAVVLIGEAGVGKGWLARAIHYGSRQREFPFARLECGRLPQPALSEGIFGERGLLERHAFGAIYLHDPGSLPREVQSLLAEWIAGSARDGRPRFITGFDAAPKKDLDSGRLLPELFANLGPIVIELPPLRERRSDLPQLVARLLTQTNATPQRLSAEAMQLLVSHDWPGNLHELVSVVLAAQQRGGGEQIESSDLPFYLRATPSAVERMLPLDAILEQVEKRLLTLALRLARNNKTRAAEILSVWRPRLLRRLEAFGFIQADEADAAQPPPEQSPE